MVDLTLPTTALQNLRSAKTSLEQYIAYLEQVMLEFRECDCTTGQTILDTQAKPVLQSYQAYLQAAQGALQPIYDAVNALDVGQKKNALEDPEKFNITLESDSSITSGNGWDKPERVEQAYTAVVRIVNAISQKLYRGDTIISALQFKRTFGGTHLRLIPLPITSGAASTNMADRIPDPGNTPDTPVIEMYIGSDQTYVHSAENITHEFGHVIVLRNGGDNSAMYKEWDDSWNGISASGIGQFISPPFAPGEGWGSNASRLQNVMPYTGSDLENERIANMFEAWVTGYAPAINSSDSREQRAAWALWTFMTGNQPPYDPQYPNDPTKTVWIDGTRNERPYGSGIHHWIQLYGNS